MFPFDVTVPMVDIPPCCGTALNLNALVDPSHISKSFLSLNFEIDIVPLLTSRGSLPAVIPSTTNVPVTSNALAVLHVTLSLLIDSELTP